MFSDNNKNINMRYFFGHSVTFMKCLFLLLYFNTCESKRYDGFLLLRGTPDNDEHLGFFKNLTKRYDVNVWQPPSTVNRSVDFIVSSDHADIVKDEANKLNISLEILHNNIQSKLDNQTVNTYARRNTNLFNWNSFYRNEDIVNWMTDLSQQYPNEISLFSIGKTIENRNIMCMKMILKGSKTRSTVIVEGGIHAREWISTAMVTYIINELIHAGKGHRSNELKEVALNYIWYFIPVFNVDGYEYSHTTDRMWRKNRRDGYGVDINRNFDAAFGTVGVTKTDKEAEEYCGTKAFSEPETQHMKTFVESVSKTLPLSHYVSFHAYGQLFIIPYTYSKKHLANFNEMKKVGDKAANRIKKKFGTIYTVGTAFDTVGYTASGVSACWAKKAHNIPYVAVLELRDTGKDGFALSTDKILPTVKETMDGMLEVFDPRRSKGRLLHGTEGEEQADTYYGDNDDDINIIPDGESKIVVNDIVISLNVFLVLIYKFLIKI